MFFFPSALTDCFFFPPEFKFGVHEELFFFLVPISFPFVYVFFSPPFVYL